MSVYDPLTGQTWPLPGESGTEGAALGEACLAPQRPPQYELDERIGDGRHRRPRGKRLHRRARRLLGGKGGAEHAEIRMRSRAARKPRLRALEKSQVHPPCVGARPEKPVKAALSLS
jgi:hypothetical protein